MESARLKNIIIMILVLLNACLLVSLGNRRAAERSSQRQVTEQLVTLFEAGGIRLDPGVIPSGSPPPSLVLTRNTEEDRALASFFLGTDLDVSNQGGGIYTYDGNPGAARFSDNGSFEIAAGSLETGDPEELARDFCKNFGYGGLTLSLENGNGRASAVQYYRGEPVFNCTVSLSFEDGRLASAAGTYLPGGAVETAEEQTPLSASGALSAFLTLYGESGGVASEVTDMYLCYELQSTAAVPMTLVPAWCVVTDAGTYYVNCSTGKITHN